jgi:hypothetical protein
MSHRTRIALAALVIAVLALVLTIVCRRDTAQEPRVTILQQDSGDGQLRFVYQVATGDETLFDIKKDPGMLRNLRNERPEDARRLREQLEGRLKQQLGVNSLEDLRAANRETIERLRSLGYF